MDPRDVINKNVTKQSLKKRSFREKLITSLARRALENARVIPKAPGIGRAIGRLAMRYPAASTAVASVVPTTAGFAAVIGAKRLIRGKQK